MLNSFNVFFFFFVSFAFRTFAENFQTLRIMDYSRAIKETIKDIFIILGMLCIAMFPFVLWWVVAEVNYLLTL